MLKAGCSAEQIAGELVIDTDTLYAAVKREKHMCFSAYSAELKGAGEALIQAAQFAKAIGMTKDGDTQLLMWLGKVRLKQKEPEEVQTTPTVPNEAYLELEQKYYKALYELEKLKNADQPKTA